MLGQRWMLGIWCLESPELVVQISAFIKDDGGKTE